MTESVGTTAGEAQSASSTVRADEVTAEVPMVEGEASAASRTRLRRRNIIVTAVVVVLAGAGIGIWLGTSSSGAPGLQITTQTVSVTTGTMQQTVATSGTIAPAQQANLNFGVSGTVTGVNVSAGQAVTAGHVGEPCQVAIYKEQRTFVDGCSSFEGTSDLAFCLIVG